MTNRATAEQRVDDVEESDAREARIRATGEDASLEDASFENGILDDSVSEKVAKEASAADDIDAEEAAMEERLGKPDSAEGLRLLEAILFASAEPVTLTALEAQLGDDAGVPAMLLELKKFYAARGVNLTETEGHWSFRTAADLASKMKITRSPRRKLPRAAAEVLAIVAYHQPVTRGDIESIRGVETSRGTLDILLELGWIRPGKRRDTPGRPLTWSTTTEFLSHFNIDSLDDLPGVEELKAAGLLDTRPVLAHLPRDEGETADVPDEDDDFAAWVTDETDVAAAE